MRPRALAALAAGALAFSGPTGTAHAAIEPTGTLCGLSTAARDPHHEGRSTARVEAAALLTDDTNRAVLYAGSISCLIRVNSTVYEFTGPTLTGVAVVSEIIELPAGPEDWVYLCTRINLASGPQLYYVSSNDPSRDGGWVEASECPQWGLATTVEARVGTGSTAHSPHRHRRVTP